MQATISFGDVSKVIHGGFLVDEETKTAIYWFEPDFNCFDNPEKTITTYCFTIADNVLTDLNWLKDSNWLSVANTADMQNIITLAVSFECFDRARVYEVAGLYYDFINLDSSPDEYTYNELLAMYP